MNNIESFNNDFCDRLEFYLTQLLGRIEDPSLKGFWCDGILIPSDKNRISKKKVNDSRMIETTAWIGKDRQTLFELIIHFGKYSLRRYGKERSLDDCLPDGQEKSIKIDLEHKLIELYLK